MMAEWGGDDRGPIVQGVVWSLTALSMIVIALRVVSRTAFGSNHLGLDDFFIGVCGIITLASSIAISLAADAGIGKHFNTLSDWQRSEAIKRAIVANSIVIWSFSMPAFAYISLLRRLFPLPRTLEMIFWSAASLHQCGTLVTSILWYTRCSPVARAWQADLQGQCGSFNAVANSGYVIASLSAFFDFFFAVYPIRHVMALNMCFKKRVAICVSLGLGIIGCIVSIYQISQFPSTVANLPNDPTYAIVPITLFANVESNVLILGACLPTLGPLLRWVFADSRLGGTKKTATVNHTRDDEPWRGNRMYRLDDDIQIERIGRVPSDDIPLVGGCGATGTTQCPNGGIVKTTQISVTYS